MVSIQWRIQVGVVIAVGLGLPLVLPASEEISATARLLRLLFSAMALAGLAIAWWFKGRLLPTNLSRAHGEAERAAVMTGPSIIILTQVFTPALFGLVLYLTQRDQLGLVGLCALSLGGHWLHRPDYDQWRAMVRDRHRDAHRPA
jgi:hypothetical protein